MDAEPITFTEISPVTEDSSHITISFRYRSSTPVSKQTDSICLFKEGEAKSLASVKVGNPSGHWMVDEGRYRDGKVVLDISKLKLSPQEKYQLQYVTVCQEILTTSNVFTVDLEDGMMNGYSCRSLGEDEGVLVEKNVQDSSLQDYAVVGHDRSIGIDSFQLSLSPAQPSSSFIIVSENDSHQQEPDALSEVENVDLSSGSDNESVPEDFESFPVSSKTTTINPESKPWTQPSGCPVSEKPLPKARLKKDKATNTEPKKETEVGVQVGGPQDELSDQMTVSSPDFSYELLPTASIDMSASVNLGDRTMSQKQAQMLKSSYREQRLKMKKLTKHMEAMQRENLSLKEKLSEVEDVEDTRRELEEEIEQMRMEMDTLSLQLEEEKRVSKQIEIERSKILGQVHEEKKAFEQKASQLELERSTLFQRSSVLLTQLQEKETEGVVKESENLVLREKLKRYEDAQKKREIRHKKDSDLRKAKKREQQKKAESQTLFHKADPNAEKVPEAHPTSPQQFVRKQQDDLPVKREQQAARPIGLPLSGGGKLKQAPLPTQRSQHGSTQSTPRVEIDTKPEPSRAEKKPHSDQKLDTSSSLYAHRRQSPSNIFPQSYPSSGGGSSDISEERIEEIASQLRGAPTIVCPVCNKILHARENEYSATLHVEQCLMRCT